MAVVRYREYREYRNQLQQANNAMMALLAGSKLAAHTLHLTLGSDHRLSEIFPSVPHIGRFDLRTDLARTILDDAEPHLGTMAVPYVLAIHEAYLMHCCALMDRAGRMSSTALSSLTAKSMHEKFAVATGAAFSDETLLLFHLVRCMRNSRIHQGGWADAELIAAQSALTPIAEGIWEKVTRSKLVPLARGDPVVLGLSELVGCLAVTKRLAIEANMAAQSTYPARLWAERLVEDALHERIKLIGNTNQRLRALKGFARRYYEALSLADADLMDAARACGVIQ